MSALLLRWLNDELKLHRRVEVLERDASNGYIIAEVLHLLGLEPQLESYENASSTTAKIHNMELLGEKFDVLGVPFPVNTRRAIMMEDRSVVLQFMLQLKDFLRRRPKVRLESAKKVVLPEQPKQAKSASAKSNLPPRDVEGRFIAETTQKFHPTEVGFHKGIDMAVHLRKFEQAQWAAENELDEFHQKAKVDNNATSTAGYTAARAHLKEKAQFMRDWDREHRDKWKHTQRLFSYTECNDLRLELTLEARRQIHTDAKRAESQQDATIGVVEFEKNMNRLGLATEGPDQSLRAIPASDAGALAHLRNLKERVDDLDFRPSNNVKMMKELRKRRKAQLAAEKDRRMRRQKALADQKKLIEGSHTGRSLELDNSKHILTEDDSGLTPQQEAESESIIDPREKYLDDRRAELEDNYARLRETGSIKREEDMKVLGELRAASRKKEQLYNWGVCSDAVDRLILLAYAIVSSSDRDTLDVEPLKKEIFLQAAPSIPAFRDQGGQEVRYELDASIQNFLSSSEVWSTLPLQSRLVAYDVEPEIHALAETWALPVDVLDTSWDRPSSFTFVSVFTEDESGVELARRVSLEHHLALLQLDPILDECVKLSYDPQKLGDQVSILSDRERKLGAFGLKISGLRQKNTALPDAMVVEIVAKAVSLCRREASTSPPETTSELSRSTWAGCMLLNFPRTLDEAKLLEKAILADIPTDESDSPSLSTQEGSSGIPEETATPVVVSAWDCVVSISADQPPLTEPAEGDKTLQASDSTPGLVDKPRPSLSKLHAAGSQRKFSVDEDQRARGERAILEAYWSQITRHIQIKRVGLHHDVLVETVHLCIDVYTQTSYKAIPVAIECGGDTVPELLKEALNKRRQAMNLIDRMKWMRASKEIVIEDDTFAKLRSTLHKLDENLDQKLREPMSTIRSVIHAISTLATTAEQDLESALLSGGDSFQALLDQAAPRLGGAPGSCTHQHRERVLTELEVSLGDMADFNRVAGNDFVDAFAQDPSPDVINTVDIVYQCLPSICFYLKDYTMQKLGVLRTHLYEHTPFLCESVQDSGRKVVLSKMLPEEAMSAATDLSGNHAGSGEIAQIAGDEVPNILGQVAAEYSFHLTDEPSSQQYPLGEMNVTTQEITRLLQRVTLLCRFADRVMQTAGQLYASNLRRLQQTVQDDIHTKNKSIAESMAEMKMHRHATWPIQDLELEYVSEIAARLPRTQKQNFLAATQLGALVSACRSWELSDPLAAGAFGGTVIASDVFVSLVLEVAAKEAFPARWRDASAVAAVTLQQCSTRGTVSWRKFVWSLLCIQFTGIPSLEDMLEYEERALTLPAVKLQRKSGDDQVAHKILLAKADLYRLPLWFEKHRSNHNAEKIKELVYQLFATASNPDDERQIELLPMLLCWCVHPSCSFSVRHELEEFAPRYPRGLFRAFQLLQHSIGTEHHRASTLFAVSGVCPPDTQQPLASFSSFHHDLPADVQRFFQLQNPLEALVQL